MAFPDQIDRAMANGKPVVGFDGMHRDAILARPPGERDAAILELVRARRCVLRAGGEHAEELLSILGLVDETEDPAEESAVPQRKPPSRIETPAEKRCSRCKQTKPAAAFWPDRQYTSGLSSRCRDCQRELNTKAQRGRRDRARAAREGAAR